MSIAIGHVRSALGQAGTPGGEINVVGLAELHVDTALPDPAAADARKIGFTRDLEREATVHDVIPAVPLGQALRVHCADEITQALGRCYADLLSPDSIHFRDGVVGE